MNIWWWLGFQDRGEIPPPPEPEPDLPALFSASVFTPAYIDAIEDTTPVFTFTIDPRGDVVEISI